MNLETVAKIVLGVGAALLLVGAVLFVFAKLGWTRLPGDLVFRGKNVTVYPSAAIGSVEIPQEAFLAVLELSEAKEGKR